MGNLSERDKIVLGKLRANYYLKPEEGRFYRKRDDKPVKGTLRATARSKRLKIKDERLRVKSEK